MSLKDQALNIMADVLAEQGAHPKHVAEARCGQLPHPAMQRGFDMTVIALMRALDTAPEGKVLINANAVIPCSCDAGCGRVDCRACGTTLS